jgi:hypothetical protein
MVCLATEENAGAPLWEGEGRRGAGPLARVGYNQ